MYIAIRTTKDEKFIEDFIGGDENRKRKMEKKYARPKPHVIIIYDMI